MKASAVIEEPRRARAAPSPPARRSPPHPVHTKTGNQSETVDESRKAFLLRINPDLWKELEAWAQTELRSINGQIEYLLRQAVGQRKRPVRTGKGEV